MNERAIADAKAALQAEALFEANRAPLRQILEHLPVLESGALPLAPDRAERLSLDAVMQRLERDWIAYPSNQQDGMLWAEADPRPDVLILTFNFYLWSISTEQQRITVARVGTDVFLYWTGAVSTAATSTSIPAPPRAAWRRFCDTLREVFKTRRRDS